MDLADVARLGMINQRLVGGPFRHAVEVVESNVAVQSQDFAGAIWGVGQRVLKADDEVVESAFTVARS